VSSQLTGIFNFYLRIDIMMSILEIQLFHDYGIICSNNFGIRWSVWPDFSNSDF